MRLLAATGLIFLTIAGAAKATGRQTAVAPARPAPRFLSLLPSPRERPRPTFRLVSRSEAERRFKSEQEELDAGVSPTVTIEWLHQPFFHPTGHAALRVGNQAFEFTPYGWRLYDGGMKNARAFLFNNPFFRKQVRTYGEANVAPFSLGISMRLPREVVERALRGIREDAAGETEFSILVRNCNLRLLTFFPELRQKEGLAAFSSAMTFSRLLANAPFPAEAPTLYPTMPLKASEAELNARVPEFAYRPRSAARELLRIASNMPTALRTSWVQKYVKLEVKRLFGLRNLGPKARARASEAEAAP